MLNNYCQKEDNRIYLRVDDKWFPYEGTTSLRKIYYRAYSALCGGGSCFYVYEFDKKVTGAMFPNSFWKHLSCSSINGVSVENLPQRVILNKKNCEWSKLKGTCGSVCLYCGSRK